MTDVFEEQNGFVQLSGKYLHIGDQEGQRWGITIDECEQIWHDFPTSRALILCTDAVDGFLELVLNDESNPKPFDEIKIRHENPRSILGDMD